MDSERSVSSLKLVRCLLGMLNIMDSELESHNDEESIGLLGMLNIMDSELI